MLGHRRRREPLDLRPCTCPRLQATMNPSSSCLTEMRSQYKNGKDTKSILGARNGVPRRYETNAEDLTRVETVPGRNRSGNPGKKMDCVHILESIGVLHIDRFNQILRSLPGLTPRVLIMRLNELEESGLITPIIIQKSPKLVSWTLTENGQDTLPILEGYFSFTKKWHPNATLKNHRTDSVKRPSLLELVEERKQELVWLEI